MEYLSRAKTLQGVSLSALFLVSACSALLDLEDSYTTRSGIDAAARDDRAWPVEDASVGKDAAIVDATPRADASKRSDAAATDASTQNERYVFATISTFPAYLGPAAIAALASADARCRMDANSSKDPALQVLKGRTWKAWLSNSAMFAIDRIEQSAALTWIRADGAVIFPTSADITGGAPLVPIDISGRNVWTGDMKLSCGDWTDAGGSVAVYGTSNATDETWTNAGFAPCLNMRFSLYCFETRQ
jgi:hypothetical protein